MFSRKKKGGGSGHIVPRTQGTSNEISFSVLHNISNTAAQEGAPERPAWEFPTDEVRARRTRRRRANRLVSVALALAATAALVLVGAVVFMNVQNHLDHVAHLRSILSQVTAECDNAAKLNGTVDAALVQTVGNTPYEQIETQWKKEQQGMAQTTERLQSLKRQIESQQTHLGSPADIEASNQGIAAINAQLNMVEMSKEFMPDALAGQLAYTQARNAMAELLEANDMAREATELIAQLNMETAAASLAKSQECKAKFEGAYENLVAARDYIQNEPEGEQKTQAENVLSSYIDYADLRIKSQQAAINSMQAYIDRTSAPLQQANDEYNTLEAQAAEIISQQDTLPEDAVAEEFANARTEQSTQWSSEAARLTVALNDVRDYLG